MSTNHSSIVRVGVDLAKSVMQVHAVSADGSCVVAKQVASTAFLAWCEHLPRGCMVAMEACSPSHYWGRCLLVAGLDARLISPSFVTPYRLAGSTGKNDANDAEAICEAAARPRMRFVPVKTTLQQNWLAVHTVRDGYMKHRKSCMNRIRGILTEFGVVIPTSPKKFREFVPDVLRSKDVALMPVLRTALRQSFAHLLYLERQLSWCDKQLVKHVRSDKNAMRAIQVWGIGVIGASAIAATAGDLSQFRNGRQFGAWLGLVPSQHSTGGIPRLGRITRRGDAYLRRLMITGARCALRVASGRTDATAKWAVQTRDRIGMPKAAVALANKNARILWATVSKAQEPHAGPKKRLF